jgi:HD-like signal output (HDOD) protein
MATTLADKDEENLVASVGIPACPAILIDLSAEARKDSPDFRRIEQLIETDVGLTATLLKMVNSPFFGLSSRIGTVRQAISILGFAALSRTISGLVLRNVLSGKNQANLEQFWDRSAKLAAATAFIAKQIPGMQKDIAYTFALFQNCGIPLLLQRFPDYKETLARAEQSPDQKFTEIEDAVHGTNHATIGYLLTRTWHLPEDIAEAVRFHHDGNILSEQSSELTFGTKKLVALSVLADYALLIRANKAPAYEWLATGELALEYLGVNAEEFEDIVADVKILLE